MRTLETHQQQGFLLLFLFAFIFGCVGSLLLRRLSLVVVSGGYSSLPCAGFSLQWLLLLRSTSSRCMGISSCSTRAQYLWRTGLVAPWQVGSSQTRAQTRVPYIGRRILNHCATRAVPATGFNILFCCNP